MPFNAANPSDSEKIRRLGIVIRPNWDALEQGSQTDSDNSNPTLSQKLKLWSVNFFNRNDIPSAPGDDAPTVENAIVLFSKTDTNTTFGELFTRHENATVTQLTKGPANIEPVGFPNNGETSLYGGLVFKYGRSAIISGNNQTATQTFVDIGLTDFPNAIFSVLLTPITTNNFAGTPRVQNLAKTGFDIAIVGNSNNAYNWIAIGN